MDLGAYGWLRQESGPRILVEAVRLYGTTEKPGPGDNPAILGWAKELGISAYTHDSIAWCGLFVGVCAKRAGYEIVTSPLWARSWMRWGTPAKTPSLGDVLVFVREGGGHVGLYVGEDGDAFHVLGGNQSDQVKVSRIARARLLSARRSAWHIAQPSNVRPIRLATGGALSTNEE